MSDDFLSWKRFDRVIVSSGEKKKHTVVFQCKDCYPGALLS